MVEFRKDAAKILGAVRRGTSMTLTHRGQPVIRLEPIAGQGPDQDDPFYRLSELADGNKGSSLTNEQIDDILYGR